MFSGDKKAFATSALVALLVACGANHAEARTARHHSGPHSRVAGAHVQRVNYTRYAGARVIQCVAFAKQDAGIDISGNARDWWGNAAGIYERGSRPENGSVLSFRANGRMPLGHVAVVSGVTDGRTIMIDQSHWGSRGITRAIEVKDVSENNDWSAVRVELGHGGGFGSIYPTHGFIYPRPDHGSLQVNLTHTPMPNLDPAPADLRGAHTRHSADTEIAESTSPSRPLDLSVSGLSFDAPNRALR